MEGLTQRQIEVVQLLALGKTNKEIATALNLGEGTVKMHVWRIFRKLNLDSRLKIALWALDTKEVGCASVSR